MGNINDNIRSKKLYKSGEVDEAYKDSNGDIVVPTSVAAELDAIDGITEVINDFGVFHVNKHLLKEIENMRLDIEELHGFIKAAFGKDYTQASSKGDTGDRGLRGYTGPSGSNGADGAKGDTGSAGTNGAKGDTGSAGSNGSQGIQGIRGLTGAAGSAGARGATGSAGAQGAKGDTGSAGAAGATGPAGADGNSHLSNITSIGINSKTGQLEIVIGRSTYKFNPDK